MKKITLFLLGCIFFSLLHSQGVTAKRPNSLTANSIKGRVKSLVENSEVNGNLKSRLTFRYDLKGNLTSKDFIDYTPGSSGYNLNLALNKTVYKYDQTGNILEMSVEEEAIPGKITKYKSTYKYNDKGMCIEWNFFNTKDILTNKTTYHYDERGNMVEQNSTDQILGGKTICRYDEKGNQTEEKTYDNDKKLVSEKIYGYNNKGKCVQAYISSFPDTSKITYAYDDNGRMIKKIDAVYSSEEGDYLEVNTYTYDERGFLHEEKVYESINMDSPVNRYLYQYDEKGNLTVQNKYNETGSPDETSAYQYDKTGNWIQQVITSGGVVKKKVRTITYY